MPKASVIIVNYNGSQFIIDCLKALENQSFEDYEIIVVDNDSKDDSLDLIAKLEEKGTISRSLKVVPLDTNTGFSGGNLWGLKQAKGDYIALLNNDTEPDKMWLEELVKAMDNDYAGICASKLIVHGSNIIDSAGDGFSSFLKGYKRGEGERASLYNKSSYVFGACAGATLYRRSMLEEIGFFDEDFFLIHEDTDLNLRAQVCGWKVLYVPTAIVNHKVRSSIGHMSDTAIYYSLRNSEFVRIKNIPLELFIRYLPEIILGTLMDFIYYAIKHKKLRLYFKAKKDFLKMLPNMFKKRKVIMEKKKATNKYIASLMTSVWQKSLLKAKAQRFING